MKDSIKFFSVMMPEKVIFSEAKKLIEEIEKNPSGGNEARMKLMANMALLASKYEPLAKNENFVIDHDGSKDSTEDLIRLFLSKD